MAQPMQACLGPRGSTPLGAGFATALGLGLSDALGLGLALVDLRLGLGFAVGVGLAVRRGFGSRMVDGLSTAASGWLAAGAGYAHCQ